MDTARHFKFWYVGALWQVLTKER